MTPMHIAMLEASLNPELRLWVRDGKTLREHMFSELPQIADVPQERRSLYWRTPKTRGGCDDARLARTFNAVAGSPQLTSIRSSPFLAQSRRGRFRLVRGGHRNAQRDQRIERVSGLGFGRPCPLDPVEPQRLHHRHACAAPRSAAAAAPTRQGQFETSDLAMLFSHKPTGVGAGAASRASSAITVTEETTDRHTASGAGGPVRDSEGIRPRRPGGR